MGGYGSGRYGAGQKATTASLLKLDLADLRRKKPMEWLERRTLEWSRFGEVVATVRCTALGEGLLLKWYANGTDGKPCEVEQTIPFVWTDTRFNGRRQWLACPDCARRCRVLYGPRFRCRGCHGLAYESQYEAPYQRLLTKAQRIRCRLGGSGFNGDQFPEKPKGMHWRTYDRLEETVARAENFGVLGLMQQYMPAFVATVRKRYEDRKGKVSAN